MYVVMLHSVGNDKSSWSRRWLSVSLGHFEALCQYLVRKKYTTHFLDEWYDYFSLPRKKDPKKIVMTFDDGYLDNWVYVFPLLKKYGLKATIFINPEFVDPGNTIRFNLDDITNGSTKQVALQSLGFLNWPEIKAMDASGVIDIQSHSMSHNFYFRSNKVVDIYTGQPKYDWIPWFIHPEQKPFYMTEDQSGLVSLGFPVFEYGRSLGIRRYFPDDQLVASSIQLYRNSNQNNGEFVNKLNALLDRFPGRFEDDNEIESRYLYELVMSKSLLEEKLNKKVDFLCWPGGGFNTQSMQISVQAGYIASTLGSALKEKEVNNTSNYKRIPRFGLSSFYFANGEHYYIKDKSHLIKSVKARTGHSFIRVYMKFKKELFKRVLL